MRIIVGFSAGGGYDAYSRVIGRHLHKHISGNPTVVFDNMAGSLLATRFPFDRNRTSKTQQDGDLSSILSIRSSVCSDRADRLTINLPGLWFSF